MGCIILRMVGFTIFLGAAFLISIIVHETGHLITIEQLGGEGKINFSYLTLTSITSRLEVEILVPPRIAWPVYLSGGIYGALFPWLFLWFFSWKSRKHKYVWIEATSACVMLIQFFYGVAELSFSFFGHPIFITSLIAGILAIMIILYILYIFYARAIMDWIETAKEH